MKAKIRRRVEATRALPGYLSHGGEWTHETRVLEDAPAGGNHAGEIKITTYFFNRNGERALNDVEYTTKEGANELYAWYKEHGFEVRVIRKPAIPAWYVEAQKRGLV